MLTLEFNGQIVELDESKPIAITYQVNDLNSVADRQATFTRTIKVPKTAKNIRIMEHLTMPGNASTIPYVKNTCNLYNENGERLINNGRGTVKDGGESYDVEILEGIVDFYKAIENKTLANLWGAEEPNELAHAKTVESVIASWQSALPYRYILADYNGMIGDVVTNTVNIDYLVPSVNVKFLWDKIFAKFKCTYSGSIFNMQNFTNLWMTYPKGVASTGENDVLIFESNSYTFESPTANSRFWCRFLSTTTNTLDSSVENVHMIPGQAGTYRLEIKGELYGTRFNDSSSQIQDGKIFIGKNGIGLPSSTSLQIFQTIGDDLTHGQEFEIESPQPFQLSDTDSICIVATRNTSGEGAYSLNNGLGSWLHVKLIRVDPTFVDFSTVLTDFSIRDFFTEVLHRFGLTMFRQKYDNYNAITGEWVPHYAFLTMQEILQSSDAIDWSDKFSKSGKEDFIYGDYAQRSFFRYNYNDKESDYNDGYLDVSNVNLPDTKDVIKSKIYSPERETSGFFVRRSNVYKLWDKEISEDDSEPIKYKSLDKRYYFMRAEFKSLGVPLTIKSYALNLQQNVNSCYMESFYKLPFAEIIQDYYGPIEQILDRSSIIQAEMYLNDTDISNLDFRKLYYISALSNYYLLNKVINYIPGKPTQVEMVRVLYAPALELQPAIKIYKVVITGYMIKAYYTLNVVTDTIMREFFDYASSGEWSSSPIPTSVNPFEFTFVEADTIPIRLRLGAEISNVVDVTIPGNTTIEIP